MQQQLIERRARGSSRSFSVNAAESPLAWLKARSLVTERQFAGGEQLREDYERAALAASVTMRWDPTPRARGGTAPDPTTAQVAARRRFSAAVDAAGPGLSDILWRVVCACETLPTAERALGWPARSGRLVLTLALDRVADYYRAG